MTKFYLIFCCSFLTVFSHLKLYAVVYTAVGCPGPVSWTGFSAAGSPFWNGSSQLTVQPANGDILVIPSGCTINLTGNITANNTITLNINGRLNFSTTSDKLNLNASSRINVPTGGSISGGSASNQIKIGTGGAEWSGPGTSNGPFYITNGVLPIELVDFYGECNDAVVNLYWSTASELNNNYFLIEQSNNGLDWFEISKVKGAGTSKIKKNYTLAIASFDKLNIQYYRLKQVDFDGTINISDLITVNCDAPTNNSVSIYPNPINTELNLHFSLSKSHCAVLMKIHSARGKLLEEKTINLVEQHETIHYPIHLKNGFYVISFISDCFNVSTQKFIVYNQ